MTWCGLISVIVLLTLPMPYLPYSVNWPAMSLTALITAGTVTSMLLRCYLPRMRRVLWYPTKVSSKVSQEDIINCEEMNRERAEKYQRARCVRKANAR